MAALLDPVPIDVFSTALQEAASRAEAGRERVILTRNGTPIAALVPLSDLEAIEDAEDMAAAADALAEYTQSGKDWPGYTREELAAKWGIDVSDDASE
jgi:prevent-host-death family protein